MAGRNATIHHGRSEAAARSRSRHKNPDCKIDPLPAPEETPSEEIHSERQPGMAPIPSAEIPKIFAEAIAPTAPSEAPKPRLPKKTKYSITKANVSAVLGLSGPTLPVRETRAFLLSLPRYKAQEVALMDDQEIRDAFAKDYAALRAGSGIIILPPAALDNLSKLLYSGETYFLQPAASPELPEAYG